jgi:acetyltransferase-like isoleucine patch superfamily enzyme
VIKELVQRLALRDRRAAGLYKKICNPNGRAWADFLRVHGGLAHLGAGTSILTSTNLVDPPYLWIGSRVCLGSCTLVAHDGSIEILYQRYGMRLDRVAPIIIEDDVYVGENALILGGSTIGEGSIVGGGAVVRQRIPPGSVVLGNPAKVVAKVEDVMRFWEAETEALPWADLIAKRDGVFDPAIEPELCRLRQEHFFGELSAARAAETSGRAARPATGQDRPQDRAIDRASLAGRVSVGGRVSLAAGPGGSAPPPAGSSVVARGLAGTDVGGAENQVAAGKEVDAGAHRDAGERGDLGPQPR